MLAHKLPWIPSCSGGHRPKAAELGISFAEYIRRLVAGDVGGTRKAKPDISIMFDLVDEGPPTNIARDKDKMVGEAVWHEYLRDTGRPKKRKVRRAKDKR
jgi:hypothetical protein